MGQTPATEPASRPTCSIEKLSDSFSGCYDFRLHRGARSLILDHIGLETEGNHSVASLSSTPTLPRPRHAATKNFVTFRAHLLSLVHHDRDDGLSLGGGSASFGSRSGFCSSHGFTLSSLVLTFLVALLWSCRVGFPFSLGAPLRALQESRREANIGLYGRQFIMEMSHGLHFFA